MGIKPRILWSLFLMTFLLTVFILEGLTVPLQFLDKLPQLVTIFLSIIIQALPFILLGIFWLRLNTVLRHGSDDPKAVGQDR